MGQTGIDTVGDPCGALAVDDSGAVFAVTVGNGAPPQVLGFKVELNTGVVGDEHPPYPDLIQMFEVDLPYPPRDEGCHTRGLDRITFAPVLGVGRLYVGSEDGQLHIVE
jgi:hypothetical protein